MPKRLLRLLVGMVMATVPVLAATMPASAFINPHLKLVMKTYGVVVGVDRTEALVGYFDGNGFWVQRLSDGRITDVPTLGMSPRARLGAHGIVYIAEATGPQFSWQCYRWRPGSGPRKLLKACPAEMIPGTGGGAILHQQAGGFVADVKPDGQGVNQVWFGKRGGKEVQASHLASPQTNVYLSLLTKGGLAYSVGGDTYLVTRPGKPSVLLGGVDPLYGGGHWFANGNYDPMDEHSDLWEYQP